MGALQLGYIRNPRADLIWFVALPFAAIAVALGFHHWLPYIAAASIAVWVTIPHHYATWIRAYGLEEDWSRWRDRLTLGPLLLVSTVVAGATFAPLTLAIVLMLWDNQHSVMQQHGFARIYDFKAGAGAPSTRRFDLWLTALLYGNMLLTAPLWTELWIAGAYTWNLGEWVTADRVALVHTASWTITGAYAVVYVAHVARSVSRGYPVNPMKYLFLLASFSLWYYVSWQDSYLIYTVAHRIMHGVQYIVMVYWYLGRKAASGQTLRLLGRVGLPRFLLLAVAYAVVFQLVIGADLGEFSFGLVGVLQADGLLDWSPEKAAGLYAATAINAAGAVHYYFDSFIWKVSDSRTQGGL